MAHFWNNILVVEFEELAPRFYSAEALSKTIYRYSKKNYGINRVQRPCKGQPALIAFDSLPREIQAALGDPRKVGNILEKYYETDPEAMRYYADFKRPGFGYLKPEEQEKYIVNASVLRAVVALEIDRTNERLTKGGSLRGTRDGMVKSVAQTIYEDAIDFNSTLKAKFNEEHSLPKHPRRFASALRHFKTDSYYSLVRDPEGKTFKNAQKVDDSTIALLNSLFATQKHKPTATEIFRQYDAFISGYLEIINNSTGELYDAKSFSALSDSTIKAYLAQWSSKIATHAKRSGDRQVLMHKFKPHHSMSKPNFANSIISIDDRQPPFLYDKGKRPWFYNGIDIASEAWVVWVDGKSKEGIIVDFYRQLVRNYHEWELPLPFELECESSLNSSFKDTFLKDGAMFQKVRIEANNARGKIVERKFGQIRYDFEKQLEGWIPRPFAKSEANQSKPGADVILPYETIVENSINQLIAWNNMAHPDQVKYPNKSRWEVFIENQNPDCPPTNYKSFMPHLGYKTVTSCNAGIIRLQHAEYLLGENGEVALSEDLIHLMSVVEGQTIDIYWLNDNYGEVFKAMIYMDGRYICEAIQKPIYNRASGEQTPTDVKARAIMSSYVATIEGYQRRTKNAIDNVTIIDNRPRTISNSFVAPGTAFKAEVQQEQEVEVLADYTDEEVITRKANAPKSWKDAFLNQ